MNIVSIAFALIQIKKFHIPRRRTVYPRCVHNTNPPGYAAYRDIREVCM